MTNNSLLRLLMGAFCISFAPVFVKLLNAEDMGPGTIVFWRNFSGAVILFTWAIISGRKLFLNWTVMRWLALAGFAFFLDLYAWHKSIIYCGAGMATILANTQVFSTATACFFLFKEKLTIRFYLASIAAIFGVALLIGVATELEFTSGYIKGIVYGLLTGIFYASFLITLKYAGKTLKNTDFIMVMAWISLFCAVAILPAMAIEKETFMPSTSNAWILVIGIGLVAQVFGWWLIASTIPKVKGAQAGLILLLQPILATVWGVLFFGEYLDPSQIVGAIITLTAIYYGSSRNSEKITTQ